MPCSLERKWEANGGRGGFPEESAPAQAFTGAVKVDAEIREWGRGKSVHRDSQRGPHLPGKAWSSYRSGQDHGIVMGAVEEMGQGAFHSTSPRACEAKQVFRSFLLGPSASCNGLCSWDT